MKFDRARLFAGYSAAFAALKPSQRAGLDALLAAAEADAEITDLRWLAYMLATVKHECADTWRPIEEYGKGKGRPYGKPVTVKDEAGNSYTNTYYGRGYVQLTWDYNYRSMGKALGKRLLYEPSLALDPAIAYAIMSYGMRTGAFTGAKLARFINAEGCDYVNARKIINGLDQANRIAAYARKLETVLRGSVIAAMDGVPAPAPSVPARFKVTAATLNVRSGPATTRPTVPGSPLGVGTLVEALEDQGGWKRVVEPGSGVTGWVSARYLQPG